MKSIVQLDLLGQNDEPRGSVSVDSRLTKSEAMNVAHGASSPHELLCRDRSMSSSDVNRPHSTLTLASSEAKTLSSVCNGVTPRDGQADEILCECSRRLTCGHRNVVQPVANGYGNVSCSSEVHHVADGGDEGSRATHDEVHLSVSHDTLLGSKTSQAERRELGALYAVACPPWIGLQESLHNTTTQPADATPFEQALRRALSLVRERDAAAERRGEKQAQSAVNDMEAIASSHGAVQRERATDEPSGAMALVAAPTANRADEDDEDVTTPQTMPLVEVHTSFTTDRLTTVSSLGSTFSRTQPLWTTASSTTASPLQPASLPRMQHSAPCYRTASASQVAPPPSHHLHSVDHSPASFGFTSSSLNSTTRPLPPSVKDRALLLRHAFHTSPSSGPGIDMPRTLDDVSSAEGGGSMPETQLDASLTYFSMTDSLDSARRTRTSGVECFDGNETSRWTLLNVYGPTASITNNNNYSTSNGTSGATTAAEWAYSLREQATPSTRAMAATTSDAAATPYMSDLLPLWTFSRPAALTRERGSPGRGRTGVLGRLSREPLSVQPLRALVGKRGTSSHSASRCSNSYNGGRGGSSSAGPAVGSCASLTAMSSGIFSFSSRGAMMSRVELPLTYGPTIAHNTTLNDRVVALAAVPTPPAFTAPPPSCYMACPTAATRDVLLLMRLETLARQELELIETWTRLWRRRWHAMRLAHSQTYGALVAYIQSSPQQQLSKRTSQTLRFTWTQQQEEKLFLLRRHLHEEQRWYFDFFTVIYRHGVFDICRAGQSGAAAEYMARMRCTETTTLSTATPSPPVSCTAMDEVTNATRRSSDAQSRGSATTLSLTCAAETRPPATTPLATTTAKATTTTAATTTTTEGPTDGEESGPMRTPRPHPAVPHSASRLRVTVTSVPPSPESRYTPFPMLATTSPAASTSSASSSLTVALTSMCEVDGTDARYPARAASEAGLRRHAGSLTRRSLAPSTLSEPAPHTTRRQLDTPTHTTNGAPTLTPAPSLVATTFDASVANASSCTGVRVGDGGLVSSPSVEETAVARTTRTTWCRGLQATQEKCFYRLYARYIPSSRSPVAFHDALALMHAVIADLCARGRRQRRRWWQQQQSQLTKSGVDGDAVRFVEHAYENGDVYMGQWAQGTRHGTGVYRFAAGRLLYVGEWTRGVPHGDGILLRVHVVGGAAEVSFGCGVAEKEKRSTLDEAHCIIFGQWEMAEVTAIRAVFFDPVQ